VIADASSTLSASRYDSVIRAAGVDIVAAAGRDGRRVSVVGRSDRSSHML